MYIQNGVLVIILRIKNRMKRYFSMRMHIVLAFMVVGIVPAAILTRVFLDSYLEQSIDEKIKSVQSNGIAVAKKMMFNGYFTTPSLKDINTELNLLAVQYDGRIFVVNSNLKIISDTYGSEIGKVLISGDIIKCLRGSNNVMVNEAKQRAEIMVPITRSDNSILGVIVMNFSLERSYTINDKMRQQAMVYLILGFLCLIIFAFYYSKRMVRPLKAVLASVHHMSEGYLEDQVSISGYAEIEKISNSLNVMLTQMKTLEESRQEFVSNVSHELKTPITSIKVLADSLLMQEDAPVELYREFLTDINDEIERENNIITDLLSLVKLDKKTGDMHIATVSINELLEIILKRLKPIAMKRNIELVYESFRTVLAEVDEVKLSLAISNLIENAIKYNMDDGWVRVSLNADHKYFYIKVADSGIGIPESAQGNIFDRFYRVDKARARQTGGTGLGLSITKNVILMHNGAIKVYSQENEGSTFTVRIPISYIP